MPHPTTPIEDTLMRRLSLFGLLALLGTAVLVSQLWAKLMAPPPVSDRVARADVILTGRVIKIEDKSVSVPVAPGAKDKIEYQVAVIKVDDPILNAKGAKEIRVGFIPPPPGVSRRPGISLVEDEDVCVFLTKHTDADLHTVEAYFDVTKKKDNAGYDDLVKEAKRCAKLFADPDAGLKAKDANERLLTASMLLTRYSAPRPGATKQEPIDAGRSKQILLAIADADWSAEPKPNVVNPRTAFARLNAAATDGWNPPTDPKEFGDAAKKWLKDSAETFRVKQWVAEKSDKG
jgi:hypothetical protein